MYIHIAAVASAQQTGSSEDNSFIQSFTHLATIRFQCFVCVVLSFWPYLPLLAYRTHRRCFHVIPLQYLRAKLKLSSAASFSATIDATVLNLGGPIIPTSKSWGYFALYFSAWGYQSPGKSPNHKRV
jgi:hypothetical protein